MLASSLRAGVYEEPTGAIGSGFDLAADWSPLMSGVPMGL